MEEAIQKCLNFWFANMAEDSKNDVKYQTARDFLKERINEQLCERQKVRLSSDYNTTGLLYEAFSYAGLLDIGFVIFPPKCYIEIDPVTYEVIQWSVGTHIKIL